MWIAAKHYQGNEAPTSIRVRAEGRELVAQNASTGELVERWPFASIEETQDPATRFLTLRWPPLDVRIEITDVKALDNAPWAPLLPSGRHGSSPHRIFAWVLGVGAVSVIFVLVVMPMVARHLPWSMEERLFGKTKIFAAEEVCHAPEGVAALAKMTQRLYPKLPDDSSYSVKVSIVHGEELNAFAYLAGQIFIYNGLLQRAESASEISGLLAHEIEHVRRRHIMEALERYSLVSFATHLTFGSLSSSPMAPALLHVLMRLSFNHQEETEADLGSLERLHEAHLSVLGFKTLFARLKENGEFPSFVSDHPADIDRSRYVDQFLNQPIEPLLSEEEWLALKHICK